MNTKIIKFDLNKNLYDTLIAKQGDTKSRFLLFNLLDGSIPFSLENRSVRVYAIKPDKTEVFNDLIITDAAKGYCVLELTTQMLAVAGTIKLELMVIEGDKKLTSNIFYMDVKESINSEKAVVSTNEFGTLLTALASLDEYDNYKNEIKNARGGQVNLKTRLDNFGEQLDTIEKKTTVWNNALENGVKNDGITDNYTVLNNLITTNIGGVIYLPSGTYIINSMLTLDNIKLIGDSNVVLKGSFKIGSNVTIENIQFNLNGYMYAKTESNQNKFNNCVFDGLNGNDISVYVNDCHASFWEFNNCKFINGTTVQLISKSTSSMYIHDMSFYNCYFENKNGGTFYCGSQDHSPGTNYVNGYYNILIDGCTFIATENPPDEYSINVSFDSNEKANGDSLGHDVIIRNSIFKNGYYVFENAGASYMTIENCYFESISSTNSIISFSRLENNSSNIKFSGNTINNIANEYKNTIFMGCDNKITSNTFNNSTIVMANANKNNFSDNIVNCTLVNATTIYPISINCCSVIQIYNNKMYCDDGLIGSPINAFLLYNCNGMINIFNNIIHNKKGNFYQTNNTPIKYFSFLNNYDFDGKIVIQNATTDLTINYGQSYKYFARVSDGNVFKITPTAFNTNGGYYPSILNIQWETRNGQTPHGGRISIYLDSYSVKDTCFVENSNETDCNITQDSNTGILTLTFTNRDDAVKLMIEVIICVDNIPNLQEKLFTFTTV